VERCTVERLMRELGIRGAEQGEEEAPDDAARRSGGPAVFDCWIGVSMRRPRTADGSRTSRM